MTFVAIERMAVRITLECGHTSTLRMRTTPEGYTHDWEVFVRGIDNADIYQYIEKGTLFTGLPVFFTIVLFNVFRELFRDNLINFCKSAVLSVFFFIVYIIYQLLKVQNFDLKYHVRFYFTDMYTLYDIIKQFKKLNSFVYKSSD